MGHAVTRIRPVWKCAGACVAGLGHERDGLACQDAWALFGDEAGRVVAACLSDGAGSAKEGGRGARIAVRLASRFLCRRFDELMILRDWEVTDLLVAGVMRGIERESARRGLGVSDFACTLLAAAASEETSPGSGGRILIDPFFSETAVP